MKRQWNIHTYNTGVIFSFGISLALPDGDDYYLNSWNFHLTLFGYVLTIGTWKE